MAARTPIQRRGRSGAACCGTDDDGFVGIGEVAAFPAPDEVRSEFPIELHGPYAEAPAAMEES